MPDPQLLKKAILAAPFAYIILMIFNCPCKFIPSCKLIRFWQVMILGVFLAFVENYTSVTG